MLDQYLEDLAKEASVKQERRQHLETMDIQDLARVAGVKLAMTKCSKCGGDMHKEGSMMKCSCGMMKAGWLLENKYSKRLETVAKPGMSGKEIAKAYNKKYKKGKYKKKTASVEKEAIIGPLADISNLGIPSAVGYALGREEGRSMARSGEPMDERSMAAALLVPGALGFRAGKKSAYKSQKKAMKRGKKKESMAKAASMVKQAEEDGVKLAHEFARAHAAFDGDLEKVAGYLEAQGMEKEAIMPLLRAIGRTGANVAKGVARGSTRVRPGGLTGWEQASRALSAAPKAIAMAIPFSHHQLPGGGDNPDQHQ